jgi:hypothetical protein
MKVYWQNDDEVTGRPVGPPDRASVAKGMGREAQNGTRYTCAPAGAVQPDANVMSMDATVDLTEITLINSN